MLLKIIFVISLCLAGTYGQMLFNGTWRMNGHDAGKTFQSPFVGPDVNTSSNPLLKFTCPNLSGCGLPKIGPDQNVYLPQTYGNVIYVFNGVSLAQSNITLPSNVVIVAIAFTVCNDLIILNWENHVTLSLISYNITTSTIKWTTNIASNVGHPYYDIRISEPYIVLGSGGNLYVYKTDGSLAWSLPNMNAITAISTNGVLIALIEQNIQAFYLNNATRAWSTFMANQQHSVAISNNVVYSCSSRFFAGTGCAALNLMTGKIIWQRAFGNDILGISQDGTLIVADQNDIYFLDAATGKYMYGVTGHHTYNGAISSNGFFLHWNAHFFFYHSIDRNESKN
jgi:outer membrane protein assembly factor BamB